MKNYMTYNYTTSSVDSNEIKNQIKEIADSMTEEEIIDKLNALYTERDRLMKSKCEIEQKILNIIKNSKYFKIRDYPSERIDIVVTLERLDEIESDIKKCISALKIKMIDAIRILTPTKHVKMHDKNLIEVVI